ncbi:S41 family peptidase [Inhella sp.]|uniref:S41 family peptidase n=1 Tax=Inhella sp. TaxID=1921806 RepID=UPI0035AF2D41
MRTLPRTHTLLALALAAALTGCANTPRAVPKPFVPERMSAEDRQAAYAEVVTLIQTRYIDASHNGVAWSAVAERYRQKVLDAPDDRRFWEELNRLVGELKDAHSRVLSPLDIKATREQRGNHGLEMRPRDGRWLLTQVAGSSQAALQGLRPGLQVLQVDGQPVQQWWAEQAEKVRGSSTERSQQVLINGKLNGGEVGSERRLQLRRSDGSEFEITLRQDALQAPAVRSHLLPDGTGYLRFMAFGGALRTDLDHALRRLAPAKGLVLDLRGNPGGDLKLTTELLGWFLPPGEVGKVVTRDNKRLTALLGLLDITPDLQVKAQAQRLQQPLAVLIDERSASAAELMAAALQAKGRARVFGATSCGCLLGVRGQGEALRGGGRLVFSEIELLVDGQPRIEGVGVVPHEAVWNDPGEMLLGRDAVLAAARQWLKQTLEAPPAGA